LRSSAPQGIGQLVSVTNQLNTSACVPRHPALGASGHLVQWFSYRAGDGRSLPTAYRESR